MPKSPKKMASSAFKSTTRRANPSLSSSSSASASAEEKKVPTRRSRSVSAVPRTGGLLIPPPENRKPSASDEFLIKRDNPLFCSSSLSSSSGSETVADVVGGELGKRGRSVARGTGIGSQSLGRKPGRSLSTAADTGRRRMRSVSREPCGRFESDVENGHRTASSLRNKENSNLQCESSVIAAEYILKEQTKKLRTWTSQHPISKSWDASTACAQARDWEDGISSSSFSETEEATIKATLQTDHSEDETGADAIYEAVRSEIRRAVSEIQNDLENAIHRRNPAITSLENIVDIPCELVNPGSAELVTDNRTEYATKLEQSRERARKLQAELAVEEQREQELSRILEEINRSQKCSDTRKCRPRRRASIERLRMSRHLEEEAMHYFDECVSISTFDSAEFSSLEDPQPGSVFSIRPTGSSRFYPNEGPIFSVSNFPNGQINHQEELDNQTRCSLSSVGDDFVSSCSSRRAAHVMHAHDNHDDLGDYDRPRTGIQFSFAREATEDVGSNEIRQYVKKFESDIRKEIMECTNVRSTYDPEDYDLSAKTESLLFDRVILGNRIESGGLLVCNIRIF